MSTQRHADAVSRLQNSKSMKTSLNMYRRCTAQLCGTTRGLCVTLICAMLLVSYLVYTKFYLPLLLPVVFTSRHFLLHNPDLCSGAERVTLMYIYSTVTHVKRRNRIRSTFGNQATFKKYNLKTLFVLGRDDTYESVEKWENLKRESDHYKDILLGDFVDSYRNLSLKGVLALDYTHQYCKNARYIIKTDDNVLVNTQTLLKDLHSQEDPNTKQTIWGQVRKDSKTCIKTAFIRWCIFHKHYNRTVYPPYMSGVGFVLTGDLVSAMLTASEKVAPFPIDDLYITGLLLEKVKGVRKVDWSQHISSTTDVTEEWFKNPRSRKIYFARF